MTRKQTVKQSRPTKKQARYSIDLDWKGIAAFCVLSCVSAGLIFYLGMVFGKATRDPNLPVAKADKETGKIQIEKEESEPVETDLKIFDIRDDKDEVKDLKKSFRSINQKADDIMDQATKKDDPIEVQGPKVDKVEIESVPAPGPTRSPKVDRPAKPQRTNDPLVKKLEQNWPENVQNLDRNQKLFSLQIMATKNKDKANRIVGQLKQQSFPAYVTEVMIEDTKIYRVRVGKEGKNAIGSMKSRLEKAVSGLGKIQVVEVR